MLNPIHICILTTAHSVDDMRVNYKFAHTFCSEGFRVSWVGPSHMFFGSNHYNKEGIRFLLGPPIRNRLDRLLSARRIRRLAKQLSNVDVYYVPDPDSPAVAIALARSNGAKVIFDLHEVYHGALLSRWLFGCRVNLVREYVRRRISKIASQCDLVIGVSDAVLASYINENIPHLVVRSCAPSWFAKSKPGYCASRAQRTLFTVMHGKNALLRGTLQVLEATAIASRQFNDLRIIMFNSSNRGKDVEKDLLMSRIHELYISRVVDMRPSVPIEEMPEILGTCDAGLITYSRELGIDSLPNRLFEYMAAGLAIVAPDYSKEIAKIIDAEQCGLLVNCEDPQAIADAIVYLRNHPEECRGMGCRAREAFEKRHNWEVEVQPLLNIIKKWYSQ